MNILQITRNVCSQNRLINGDGVSRVITQLCHYFIDKCKDKCFLAYFLDDFPKETVVLSFFSNSIHLKCPIYKTDLEIFITENKIDVIQINLPVSKEYKSQIKYICDAAHNHNVKVVFCLHVMPGFEGKDYGSIKELTFNILKRKNLGSKLKNWIITTTHPLSCILLRYAFRPKYKSLNCCDKTVLFSNSYISTYLKINNEADCTKLSIIPNPLPFHSYLLKEDIKNKTKEVIIVGRLMEEQKRISYALKIWQIIEKNPLLSDWKLSVVGNGKDEEYYYWLARQYHLQRIFFEGRQDPQPYYKRASIMMLTSGYEGWPMVLMEAMPMGCCCLAFDSFSAINDIIKDGINGHIIHDNNLTEYANCLTKLMLNDDKRIKMGINAINSSRQFSMDIIGKRWKDLYDELLTKE